MTLGQQQELFASLLPRLIDKAHELGYEVRIGDTLAVDLHLAYSILCRELGPKHEYTLKIKQALHSKTSAHYEKRAIDLNLMRSGKLVLDSEEHRPLGEFWKSLHPLCGWGGDFKKPDGNHYFVGRG